MRTPGDFVSDNDNAYTLVVNGKPEGPFSIKQLCAKNIQPGDFVKTAAMIDYKEAHEIPALREFLGFKRRPLPMQYFGSFDQRAIAAAIDWLLVFAVFVLAAFVIMLLMLVVIPGDGNKVLRTGITVGIVCLTPIAKFIYNVRLESGSRQGTLGKQLLRIRVVDLYGDRITTSKAFSRNISKLISTAMLFAGYFICLFTQKRQCLHDMIADTVVIKGRLDS